MFSPFFQGILDNSLYHRGRVQLMLPGNRLQLLNFLYG